MLEILLIISWACEGHNQKLAYGVMTAMYSYHIDKKDNVGPATRKPSRSGTQWHLFNVYQANIHVIPWLVTGSTQAQAPSGPPHTLQDTSSSSSSEASAASTPTALSLSIVNPVKNHNHFKNRSQEHQDNLCSCKGQIFARDNDKIQTGDLIFTNFLWSCLTHPCKEL